MHVGKNERKSRRRFDDFGNHSIVAGCGFGWLSNLTYFGGTILGPAKP